MTDPNERVTDPNERVTDLTHTLPTLSLCTPHRLLDEHMPLGQQLLAVVINACFVVFQGWSSAALSSFACLPVDPPQPSPSTSSSSSSSASQEASPASLLPSYYSLYQLASSPGGYWIMNMNQQCYSGFHQSVWMPIGAVTSILICLGIPLLTLLPVLVLRKRLSDPVVQLNWGWLYLRYNYTKVPYWATMVQLELLAMVLVQTFSQSLESVVQQAAILQVTLLLIVLVNTGVWPEWHPLLVLMGKTGGE